MFVFSFVRISAQINKHAEIRTKRNTKIKNSLIRSCDTDKNRTNSPSDNSMILSLTVKCSDLLFFSCSGQASEIELLKGIGYQQQMKKLNLKPC